MPRSLLLMIALSASAWAGTPLIDGVSVECGLSASRHSDLELTRIGVQRTWNREWFRSGTAHIGGYWDLSLGYWDNDSEDASHDGIFDIALTPTFRMEGNHPAGVSPYVEAGIGFHFLSHSSVTSHRRFGSSFQFGDHAGFGVRFGKDRRFDVSYRFQHLSNGGLKPPNRGINYNQLRLAMHF